MTAEARWAEALAAWAIPQEILDAAPESPWGFPPALFAGLAEQTVAGERERGPSHRRAVEALPEGGSVLDVGAGGGAGSLPLVPPAGLVVAVDESADMLEAFARLAEGLGVRHREVHGRWPDAAAAAPDADVVVCHHVFYNVPDLPPFVAALTEHARRRVVVELSEEHPQSWLNDLWRHFHGIERPTSPTASDAMAVLTGMGLSVEREMSERRSFWDGADRAEMVAFARRRLCVGPERDAEIDALLGPPRTRHMVTLWWDPEP